MVRYYASGFEKENAFGHGLGDMFKRELKATKNILFIPAGESRVKKAKNYYIPAFTKHFKNVGIEFENTGVLTPDLSPKVAQNMVKKADFIMLLGGDPFDLKKMCEKLDIVKELKKYNGVMLGFSAGAMYMSKYIITTPCNEEYPNFHIEKGLDLDDISIYPHNNTYDEEYPEILVNEEENKAFKKADLLKVAEKYGVFYLLQDNEEDISVLKSNNGWIEIYTENNGKIWAVDEDITLLTESKSQKL